MCLWCNRRVKCSARHISENRLIWNIQGDLFQSFRLLTKLGLPKKNVSFDNKAISISLEGATFFFFDLLGQSDGIFHIENGLLSLSLSYKLKIAANSIELTCKEFYIFINHQQLNNFLFFAKVKKSSEHYTMNAQHPPTTTNKTDRINQFWRHDKCMKNFLQLNCNKIRNFFRLHSILCIRGDIK